MKRVSLDISTSAILRTIIPVAFVLTLVSCGSTTKSPDQEIQDGGGDQNEAVFTSAVSRTCSRLGLAFSQTDVNFLLQELFQNIAGTGFSDEDAVAELNATCPEKVRYANALP